MKKVLLIGLILAICVLAFPQGVMAADVPVEANIVSVITFTANGPTDVWDLYAVDTVVGGVHQGPNNIATDAVAFPITSNTPFDLNVVETGGDGKMAPYSGDPLTYQIRVGDPTEWFPVSGVVNTFVDGHAADTTGELVLHTDLAQQVDPVNDVRLVGDSYEITLVFECIPHV